MKLRVDEARCTGHGRCYELAPELFAEDEQGRCRLVREQVPPELADQAWLGQTNCPEQAIQIDDD